MSLADELLADFDEVEGNTTTDRSIELDCGLFPVEQTINDHAKLTQSLLFQQTMKKIEFHLKNQLVEDEYLLIVQSNNLLVKIDNEIEIIYHYVRKIYQNRFPELEQLVQLPIDYLKTVQVNHLLQLFE